MAGIKMHFWSTVFITLLIQIASGMGMFSEDVKVTDNYIIHRPARMPHNAKCIGKGNKNVIMGSFKRAEI